MTNSVWTMLTWYLRVTYEIKKKKRKRNKNHINHSLHVIAYNGIPSSRELKRRKIVRGDKFSIFYQDNFDNRNHSWMMQSFRKELIQYPRISFNLESLERKGETNKSLFPDEFPQNRLRLLFPTVETCHGMIEPWLETWLTDWRTWKERENNKTGMVKASGTSDKSLLHFLSLFLSLHFLSLSSSTNWSRFFRLKFAD